MRLLLVCAVLIASCSHAPPSEVRAKEGEFDRLLTEVDRDKDKRITVKDFDNPLEPPPFKLQTEDGKDLTIQGVYYVSNLMQELKIGGENSAQQIVTARVFENPVSRISRLIKDKYWDNLVRKIDADNLEQVLPDS